MDNVRATVRVIECVAKLTYPGGDFVWLERPLVFLSSQVRQGFAIDIFHGDGARAFVMDEIMNADNVGMRQVEGPLCLVLELVERRTILNHQVGKKLQRDIALEFFIACEPDDPHAASSNDLDQLVAAKDFLSAGKLARSRGHEIACAFVTHFDAVYNISIEKKVKGKRRSYTVFKVVPVNLRYHTFARRNRS